MNKGRTMNPATNILISTSPTTLPARKPRLTTRALYRSTRRRFNGKELDSETGLYYYGARYLDPKTGRWLSGDPALGEYVPSAPVNEDAKKRNGSLPGMGGVFNYANLHVYHYAGNNPVKYVDPDGREAVELTDPQWETVSRAKDETVRYLDQMIGEIRQYATGNSGSISPELQQNAKDWLGIDINDKSTANGLANDLSRIRNNLASKSRDDFRFNEKATNYGAVPSSSGSIIELGPGFFNLPDVSGINIFDDSKHGILVHEATHFSSALGAFDLLDRRNQYNPSEALSLARNNPRRARSNAYNWEMFFQDYAHKR